MPTIAKRFKVEIPGSILSINKEPDIASVSVTDTLAALHVNP
jgi:hypothetical protein